MRRELDEERRTRERGTKGRAEERAAVTRTAARGARNMVGVQGVDGTEEGRRGSGNPNKGETT